MTSETKENEVVTPPEPTVVAPKVNVKAAAKAAKGEAKVPTDSHGHRITTLSNGATRVDY